MKRVLNICVLIFAVILIISLSLFNCSAKGVLALDGISAGYLDTLTYTLYLADCEKPVTDMVAYLFYDSEYLEPDRDSVDFHGISGVNRNLNLDGVIPFNFSTISSPVDFSKKAPVISIDFKVMGEGSSSIQYFIGDLDCGDINDSGSVKNFSLSCDYVVHSSDGDEIFDNLTPAILDNQDKLNEYQGGFINYADGKGEQDAGGDDHTAVTGAAVSDVTKDSGANYNSNAAIFVTAAVIVIILAVIILFILRKAFSADDNSEDENDGSTADNTANERDT